MGDLEAPVGPEADSRRLAVALGLILAFMACELAVGIVSHSLALLSDAAHMLTDAAALILSIVAVRLAARPPAGGLTFGLKRAEILSALINGAVLGVLAALVVYEGISRLVTAPRVQAWPMLAVALAGVGVNLAATWQLSRANRRSLNIKGSFRHIVTDLYAFAGTAVAAGVILGTGFDRADPLASLLVAALMLRTAVKLVSQAGRVLLEAAPAGTSTVDVGSALAAHPEVTDVHDLHVWEITSGFPSLSAHVLVRPDRDCHAVRRDLEETLAARFGIDHTTLQVDHDEVDRPVAMGGRRAEHT